MGEFAAVLVHNLHVDAERRTPLLRLQCLALRRVDYDDVLSIEHEDMAQAPLEGIRKSVELLRRVIIVEPASYQLPNV